MAKMKMTSNPPLLLLIAGAKGAVATTVAVASAVLKHQPELILPYLTTATVFPRLGPPKTIRVAGWDTFEGGILDCISRHGVLSGELCKQYGLDLAQNTIKPPPDASRGLEEQVKSLMDDILAFKESNPDARPVFINLLPANETRDLDHFTDMAQLYESVSPEDFPDLAYVLAAIFSQVPVINFTPNRVELPVVCAEAEKRGIPICGRDGKTGQTYLKVALASALKARSLKVDGWYSLNILGNADGRNLMDPQKAAGKLANKTQLLDEILGYRVGAPYGASTHKVLIDYYPPRGDAKEAWDVIDFKGLFGLPMSIRINFQCRDSILAAPLVIDLARWISALQAIGKKGPVPQLAFYFKKPEGKTAPVSFQEQAAALTVLESECS